MSVIPKILEALELETVQHDFSMPSERATGRLLMVLAAAKPGGRLLELGTGTGLATTWLLEGMNRMAHLDSVDNDPGVLAIARKHLEPDDRVTFHEIDGAQFVSNAVPASYDLIFADAWPGKYSHLDQALVLLKPGGIYVIDDMNPQPNWPVGHDAYAEGLEANLMARTDIVACRIDVATGVIICVLTA